MFYKEFSFVEFVVMEVGYSLFFVVFLCFVYVNGGEKDGCVCFLGR